MPTTLTLQLILNPTDRNVPYGRFVADTPGGQLNQRSMAWITDTGNGSPTVSSDNTTSVMIISADPDTPWIQIRIIANLPTGWSWVDGPDGDAMEITAIFGRSKHARQREQAFASPFSVSDQASLQVSAVFNQDFPSTGIESTGIGYSGGMTYQRSLTLGHARFHSAAPPRLTSITPSTFYSQSPNNFAIAGQNLQTGDTLQWSAGVSAKQRRNYRNFHHRHFDGS